MDFITADWHLGHHNIIKYCFRPFKNTDEMDICIINNINEVVTTQDRLINLGDIGARGAIDKLPSYLARINCKNIAVVKGNHDKEQILRKYFNILPAEYEYVDTEGYRIVLSHYAMRVWNHAHHGAAHLYGHSHGSLSPACGPDGKGLACFDIGVDCWDFKPLSITQIKAEIRRRTTTNMTSVKHECSRYPSERKEHHGAV